MKIIGHRGACGYLPENTIASIEKAIELGVDIVEIDVSATKDGGLVLCHDRFLKRLSGMDLALKELTERELREKVRLSGGHLIPTLEEVCFFLKDKNIQLFVEIKTQEMEVQILRTMLKYGPPEKYLIGSFYHKSILKTKVLCPEIKTIAIILGALVDMSPTITSSKCDIVAIGIEALDRTTVTQAKKMGTDCFVWTLRDMRDLETLLSCNIDGVITDYPDKVRDNIKILSMKNT